MKNLTPPPRNKKFYDRIVAAKAVAAGRSRLQAIAPLVKAEYVKYCSAARKARLNIYSQSVFKKSDRDKLFACYGAGQEVAVMKQYILDKQPRHLTKNCQYCMVGISDTFDHYLPESVFPEFAVLANNLIPACDHCNRKKWRHWKNKTDERLIVNLYYDEIPNLQFLKCAIAIKSGVPLASFSLSNLGGLPEEKFDLISRHFSQLEVIERIHSMCHSEIEKVLILLDPHKGKSSRSKVVKILADQAKGLKKSFGINYCWAVLYDSLSNSNPFLTMAGF